MPRGLTVIHRSERHVQFRRPHCETCRAGSGLWTLTSKSPKSQDSRQRLPARQLRNVRSLANGQSLLLPNMNTTYIPPAVSLSRCSIRIQVTGNLHSKPGLCDTRGKQVKRKKETSFGGTAVERTQNASSVHFVGTTDLRTLLARMSSRVAPEGIC